VSSPYLSNIIVKLKKIAMKKLSLSLILLLAGLANMSAGYQVGDRATDFRLMNVDGKYVSMSDFPDAKGFILAFTCNHCPYAVAYEDRLIEIDRKYRPLGFPVIAINPNDPAIEPRDSYEHMQKRAREKGFTFPYLFDNGQKVFPVYGASRTPHIFVVSREDNDLVVSYIGAIDDNYRDPSAVRERFLTNAIDALLQGNKPDPDFTRAIGCTIKVAE
jgi:peroxiredoxin